MNNLTLEDKVASEKPITDFTFESNLEWRLMKKLKSETKVRAFHVKVAGQNYQVNQVCLPRLGEMLYAYKATNSGRVESFSPLFEKRGYDHFQGIEYLLRLLEGEDISNLNLLHDSRYSS